MKEKPNGLTRLTIDIKSSDHRSLKALAAIKGKTMRELIYISIRKTIEGFLIHKKERNDE